MATKVSLENMKRLYGKDEAAQTPRIGAWQHVPRQYGGQQFEVFMEPPRNRAKVPPAHRADLNGGDDSRIDGKT